MNYNVELFYFINNNLANPVFDAIMPPLSSIGGFVSMIAICIIAIIILKYFKKDEYLKIAKLCLYALILSGIIVAAIKLIAHQPRPFVVLDHVRQLVIPSEPNSFPSGHNSSTFSVATVLIGKFWQNKILVALLIIFCIAIAFSRVYVGVHYPLDVVVGAMIGIVSGVVVLKLKV